MAIYRNSILMMVLVISFMTLHIETGRAEVKPPNYNFNLKNLDPFLPGNTLADIESKFKKKELFSNKDGYQVYRFAYEHQSYKFPVYVQFKDNKVTDFFARLPQYFLHDVFHQSLINKIGKQNIYKNIEEHSIYKWNNIEGNEHIYVGGCSITCFPIYYTVKKLGNNGTGEFKSLLEQMETKQP